jgi:hypothetical protein
VSGDEVLELCYAGSAVIGFAFSSFHFNSANGLTLFSELDGEW